MDQDHRNTRRRSRFSDLMATTPLCTRSVLILCLGIFILQNLLNEPEIGDVAINPRCVLYLHEYHRIITSAFFHLSIMHIAMNSLSTLGVGVKLERKMGTLHFMFTISWGVILTSVIYVFIALICQVFGHDEIMYGSAAGFSGVLFQLSVLEAYQAGDKTRNIYGLFNVPTKLYPWALLLVLQVTVPNISFVGHLSGLLVGTLQLHAGLNFLIPSYSFLREMESWECMNFIVNTQGYIILSEETHTSYEGNSRVLDSISNSCILVVSMFFGLLWNIFETLKYVVFGRYDAANVQQQQEEGLDSV